MNYNTTRQPTLTAANLQRPSDISVASNSSPASTTASQTFRSSDRGSILRAIAHKSQSLSDHQTSLLVPLQELATTLTKQKSLLHEALKHNEDEYLGLQLEQEELQKKCTLEIKTTKQSVNVLSQHKKVLVREVHLIRGTVTASTAAKDLYRFALQGVDVELNSEASSEEDSRSQSQSVERAKQMVLIRLSRKRDELDRLGREVAESRRIFQSIDQLVLKLERRVQVLEMDDGADGEGSSNGTSGTSASGVSSASRRGSGGNLVVSTPKSESWARRRISRVSKKFSPNKKERIRRKSIGPEDVTDDTPNQEIIQSICVCLSESMVLDEKINRLVAVASHCDDVMSPLLDLSNIISHDLEMVSGMFYECCALLQMNAHQKQKLLATAFGGARQLSASDYARNMAIKTINAYRRLEPKRSVPSGLSVFIQSKQ